MSVKAIDVDMAARDVSGAASSTAASPAEIAARLERLPLTSYQRTLFLIIATAWFFDSIDLGTLTFVLGSIRTEFGLNTVQTGLLSSMSFIGMFFGASLAGMAADRFGRTIVFQVSMIFWGLGSLACGLAPDLWTLAAARVLVGFGMGMEFPVAQSIVSEIIPAAKRGRYMALLEGFWPLGFIAAGLLSLVVLPLWGWRGLFIVEAMPALYVLYIRRAVPESPRWLADHGRMTEADRITREMEARVERASGQKLAPVAAVMAPTQRQDARFSFTYLWAPQYARRTIMLWCLWFFALFGYYGLTTWLGALLQQAGFAVTKSISYTVLISLAGVPGFFFSAWLVETWGRKGTCVLTLVGSAVFCYFYGTATSFTQLIACGLAMQFFLFGMWSVLYAYTPELYPTRARATGAGCASAIGRVGSLIGPYAVGVVLPALGQTGVFSMGAGAFLIAAIIVLLLGEETKGRTLEDISH